MSTLKKFLINVGLSIVIAFVGVVSYSMASKVKIPNELKPLSEKALDINIINASIANFASSNTFNENAIKKELPIAIDKLYKIKTSTEKITIPNKSFLLKENLLSGINSNISFYKQLLAILNNTKGKDIYDSLKNLNKFYTDASSFYSKCNILDLKFSNINPNFYSNIETYIYSKSTVHQDESITEFQNKSFLVSFENIVDNFSKFNKDYFMSVKKCREKKLSYDELLKELDKNTISLKELSLDLYSLSIPNDAKDCYDDFLKALNLYKDFNNELISSIKSEITSSKNPSNLTNFYTSCKKTKSSFDNAFKEFDESFNKYKLKFPN